MSHGMVISINNKYATTVFLLFSMNSSNGKKTKFGYLLSAASPRNTPESGLFLYKDPSIIKRNETESSSVPFASSEKYMKNGLNMTLYNKILSNFNALLNTKIEMMKITYREIMYGNIGLWKSKISGIKIMLGIASLNGSI